jgi:type II secretory pathway pseudopilin PulG
LVELLVVIGIIAVLIAVLLPVLAGARDRARTTQCASNIRQVMLAMQVYANDYEAFPMADDAGWRFGRTPRTWVDTMAERGYLKIPDLQTGGYGPLACPSVDESIPVPGKASLFGPHYAYNYYIHPWLDRNGKFFEEEDKVSFQGRRSRMTKNAADKILLVDAWGYDSATSNGTFTETRTTHGSYLTRDLVGMQFTDGHADLRHNGGRAANVAYLAGNVQTVYAKAVRLTPEQNVPEQPFSTYHFARDP